MESSRPRRPERDERPPRRRSRSISYDSEEERRRRRRRKERELADRERNRGGRDDEVVNDKDNYNDRESKRRRSRSPRPESSRARLEDRESKHKSTRDRSPYRSSRDKDHRSSREGSSTQVSRKAKGPLPSQEASFQANGDPSMAVVVAGDVPDKQKPSLASTGLLAAASNSVTQADGTSIALKYHEPAEARKPPAKDEWKLFVFKGADILETIELSLRSCWLVGREVAVVDMPAEHPSISKQHAVIQFRYIEKTNEFGDKLGRVRPYLIDLESANGTSLNKEEIPPSRYLELRDKDMIQFGHSTREYVLMLSPKG
ncbi:related to PML1 Subunit of the RES complex, which is required for nuclear retention of unspliced pre-mRNAs [Phialocephala subalpina]|uniref:Related to PML1 Subunit of the RES complex, which is required for nuclear retention of unspliced pre-mRNAs n=1 Tax=Phialocephala subalpina TaxID=576137 RepID=A0A1L7XH71_9HELO|nr:related to PML1 Subunit of the RES complex, which is required for nuclear retention of unspliced pre-mRNAs [Phialocephala subalpina]